MKYRVRKGIIMGNDCIEMKKLTKRYKNFTALDRVDIRVRRGDIYGLIGDNGAGKTHIAENCFRTAFSDRGGGSAVWKMR